MGVIAGIDVGAKGAIGLIYADGTAYVYDMPVFSKEINAAAVAEIFREFRPDHVYIEAVNSFGMGRTSAFNFGQGVGAIKGVLAALAIPFTPVAPTKWKKSFSLGRDKDESRAVATRLFPTLAAQFTRKKDDGRAEALLIAKWGTEQ
jgi:crossover junction endodeoxyribonuclease RuvC|tara:strand:- start:2028 stop:2468 length:441 start_codon:yes stop_codon:yes gene_type:complete